MNQANLSANMSGSVGNATKWSFAAEIAAKLIVPITNMLLARLLAPEAFGIIATINMVISFSDMIAMAGFPRYLIQHNYANDNELIKGASVAFWTNLFFSLLLLASIVVFASPIAVMVGCADYESALIISACCLPLSALYSIQEALLQRSLNYKVLFYNRLITSFLPFAITIPLAMLKFGYWSLIIGSLGGYLFKAIFMTLQSNWKPRFYFNVSLLFEMVTFSSWTLLESVALWLSTWVDIFIVGNVLNAYYTGLYKTSQTTVTGILAIITGATTSVLFSSLSRLQNDEQVFKNIFYQFQKNVAIFVIPIGVGIFMFSDTVTLLLLGDQWIEAAEFIGIWGLCTSMVCVYGTFSREVYRARGKPKISLTVQLVYLLITVPLCAWGISLGYNMFIYIRAFSYLVIIVLHMFVMKRHMNFSIHKMFDVTKWPIAASAIMAVLAWFLTSFSKQIVYRLFCIALCTGLYFGILIINRSYRSIATNSIKRILQMLGNRK